MGEARNGQGRRPAEPSDRHETILAEAFPGSGADGAAVAEMHRKIARRLLQEGSPSRAYAELVRASREAPLTPRLAAAIVWLSEQVGTEASAINLLRAGVEDNDGPARRQIRSQLIRLLRRLGEFDQAREQLTVLLAENPADRRARRVLNGLLHREQRWEELDASLERETKEALKAGTVGRAARPAFWRGRIADEGLSNPGRAALRYGEAARYFEQARDHERAFDIRLLWLRALHRAKQPKRAVDEAITQLKISAERVGKVPRADALLRDLGLIAPVAKGAGRKTTQAEFIAAAEDAERRGKRFEAAAMLNAVLKDTADDTARHKLEALLVRRGAWRELADFYRERARESDDIGERLEMLSRLAELLEDELRDFRAAEEVYGEMVALGDDDRALKEQLRLLKAREDRSGIRRALDKAVDQAADAGTMASALVARGDAAVTAKDLEKAKRDFQQALKISPRHLGALAGLAELGAQQNDRRPVSALQRTLASVPKRQFGRADAFRRLARVADQLQEDPLSIDAWSEVLAELPADEEAVSQLSQLLRDGGDIARLEPVLRAQLQKAPRGAEARRNWRELVFALEKLGRPEEALKALRNAVGMEPGHHEAWLMLADRCEQRALAGEAAWAMEHAATSTADDDEREKLWARLARYTREVLKDPKTADQHRARAEKLRAEREARTSRSSGLPSVLASPPKPQEHAKGRAAFTEADRTPRPQAGQSAPLEATPIRPSGLMKRQALDSTPIRPSGVAKRPPDLDSTPIRPSGAMKRPAQPMLGATPVTPSGTMKGPRATLGETPISPSGKLRAPEPTSGLMPIPEVRADVPRAEWPEEKTEGRDEQRSPTQEFEAAQLPDEWDPNADILEVTSGEIEPPSAEYSVPEHSDWEAPPGRMDWKKHEAPPVEPFVAEAEEERPATQELALGPDDLRIDPSWSGAQGNVRRQALFKVVREKPLESAGYHDLSGYFDEIGDTDRSALMSEIATALEGDPDAAPLMPRLILNATDRAGLRHPTLRHEVGELLSLCGVALCRLYPEKLPTSARDEFRLDSGKGAPLAAEALLAAVRILGIRAPDLFLSDQNGPPFSLVFGKEGPRLAVGRLAVKKELPQAELRFFAGRALFTQNPDLLALRLLKKEQLQRGLMVLGGVLKGSRSLTAEGRAMRDALPAKGMDRLRFLFDRHVRTLSLPLLMEGARHSANRAGLVVSGSVAPALHALRAKKALQSEMEELIRFAASERYLQLRQRRIGAKG